MTCRDRYGISVFKTLKIADCGTCGRRRTACYTADSDQDIDWTLYQMGTIEFTRASGAGICRQCNEEYRKHPLDRRPEALGYDGEPFLHVLCDGRRVKL